MKATHRPEGTSLAPFAGKQGYAGTPTSFTIQ